MLKDELHPLIKSLLTQNGAMGVNQLQKELDIPLSTLQKYLDKQQTYFKKNHSRKWVLPEEAAEEDMSVVTENYRDMIDGQIKTVNTLVDTLMVQFRATITLIETVKPIAPAVAEKPIKYHPRITGMQEKLTLLPIAVRQHKKNIPEEYVEILLKVDWFNLAIEKGSLYIDQYVTTELTNILTSVTDKLPEELLEVLEKYQLD